MANQVNVVYRTDDYSIFKQLPGNRDVLKARVGKITKSIKDNGYIFNPIICNRDMQVVDGQGRLKALQKLGLPVDYIIEDNLGIKECVALNVYLTKWSTLDYINSYADMGNTDYGYLRYLVNRYNTISVRICVSAVSRRSVGFEISNKSVQNGDFTCTAEQYEYATGSLAYLEKFIPYMDVSKGRRDMICSAVLFAYGCEAVDNERLFSRFKQYYSMDIVKPFNSVEGALVALNSVYNFRSREDRIHLEVEYEKALRDAKHGVTAVNNRKPITRKVDDNE